MKTTTIRFSDQRTAQLFAQAARRRGLTVHRSANDVTVESAKAHVERVLKKWSLNRGGLPTFTVIDWT